MQSMPSFSRHFPIIFQQFTGAVSTTVVALLFTSAQTNVPDGIAIGSRNDVLVIFVLVTLALFLFTVMSRKTQLWVSDLKKLPE
jgi:hypothetical protein